MRNAIGAVLVLVVCFASSLNAAQPTAPALAITVGDGEIRLQNVGEKGAVLLGATIRQEISVPTLRRFAEVLQDPDHDGNVIYKPQGGTPLRGIWVAIDCESGSLAVAGRQDYTLTRLPFPHGSAKRDAAGLFAALEEERLEMDLVVVRPGVGAWTVRAREGGKRDGDGQANGRLRIVFENAKALAGTSDEAPKRLKKRDVIAAIDTGQMEVFTTALEE